MSAIAQRVRVSAELVAFHHTIFALPFAFMGMMLAAKGAPPLRTIALITAAMVSARTAAMSFNRIADERFDRMNPRTAGRPLPSGRVSRAWAAGLLGVASAAFFASAAMLNRTCLYLSPLALAIVLSYSLTKRFTSLTHVHLGASLGLAPVGAWIAVRGTVDAPPLLLGLAVTLWTAGFDIIYACQDVEFDRKIGLHSLPARIGVAASLQISMLLHALMVAALAALPLAASLGWAYGAGVAGVTLILAMEHAIVRPGDLSKVNAAFFTANGWVSVGLFAATLADLALR